MTIDEMKRLQEKYGLTYHVSYALTIGQMIGLQGKRVLEVGGSLPRDFVLDELGAIQWISVEEMDYWGEVESSGQVTGTPPPAAAERRSLMHATADSLPDHGIFHGKIEDMPPSLAGHFDVVFSIAAFEHIAQLPEALEHMHAALCAGGKLCSIFAPIWSCYYGHHLPGITDARGTEWSTDNLPIPPWGHLLMRPMELYDHLCQKTDPATARKIVYFVFYSPHINRYFLEDYIEVIKRSSFLVEQVTPIFEQMRAPLETQQKLESLYPGRSRFSHSGMLLVLKH